MKGNRKSEWKINIGRNERVEKKKIQRRNGELKGETRREKWKKKDLKRSM